MVHFILNPHSGTNSPQKRARILGILEGIPQSKVWQTERVNHATELTKQAIFAGAKKIIAIGGDGTINEVASALLYSDIPLGIIPMGSGNGLANHLGIPLAFRQALERAMNGEVITIDAASWNDRPFFCTAGIGFDAYVAAHFAKRAKRGFLNYIYSTFVSLREFRPINLPELGSTYSFTIANANQFGNNAYISPQSNLQDGLLESIQIKPGSVWEIMHLGISLFLKNVHLHPLSTISSIKTLVIQAPRGIPFHLDGESFVVESNQIEISILPASLRIVK